MNKIIIIIFIFVVNTGKSQPLSSLSETQLLDSLRTSLFPFNNIEEQNDTLWNFGFQTIEDKIVIIKGRRNQPNKVKAILFFKEIRNRKLINFIDIIKNYYIQYENNFKEEWGCCNLWNAKGLNELDFFVEFEKTLFYLEIEKTLQSEEEKYQFVKESINSFYSKKKSNLVFSDYFEENGAKRIDVELSFLKEKYPDLESFLLEDLATWDITKVSHIESKKVQYFQFYYPTILIMAGRESSNSRMDTILVKRYSDFKKVNQIHEVMNSLITRERKVGIDFILRKRIFDLEEHQDNFINSAFEILVQNPRLNKITIDRLIFFLKHRIEDSAKLRKGWDFLASNANFEIAKNYFIEEDRISVTDKNYYLGLLNR